MLSVKGWVGNKKDEEKADQIDGDHEEAAGEERFPQGGEMMPRSLRVE
jgi:hypothetical protein